MDHQFRIQRRDLGPHGCENSLRRALGRHDLRERPVPVVCELTMRVVDDQRRCSVDIERHVTHDADNLAAPSASGIRCPITASKRHAWKCRAERSWR